MKARLGPDLLEVGHAHGQKTVRKSLTAGQPDRDIAQRAAPPDFFGDTFGLQRGGSRVCGEL
ncbi:hypothetical protein D3C75_1183110 [compost metagenome]